MRLLMTTVVLANVIVAAQNRPNLSGQWVPKDASRDSKEVLVITQNVKALTVDSGGEKMTFVFDSTTKQTGSSGVEIAAKSSWSGEVLVTVLTISTQGTERSVQEQRWSIDREGVLQIETTERRKDRAERKSTAFFIRAVR